MLAAGAAGGSSLRSSKSGAVRLVLLVLSEGKTVGAVAREVLLPFGDERRAGTRHSGAGRASEPGDDAVVYAPESVRDRERDSPADQASGQENFDDTMAGPTQIVKSGGESELVVDATGVEPHRPPHHQQLGRKPIGQYRQNRSNLGVRRYITGTQNPAPPCATRSGVTRCGEPSAPPAARGQSRAGRRASVLLVRACPAPSGAAC